MKKFSQLLAAAVVVLLAAVFVIGCKDEVSPPPSIEELTLFDENGQSLNGSVISIFVGETKTLAISFTPADADEPALAWDSSNPAIAAVDDGVITGIALGQTTVTVSLADNAGDGEEGGPTAAVTVNVIAGSVPVTGIRVVPTSSLVNVGGTAQLSAVISPSNATNKHVTWTSNSPSRASVEGGLVTGKADGTAEITVTSTDGGFTAVCVVTVTEDIIVLQDVDLLDENGQSLDGSTIELFVGETKWLSVSYNPPGASDKTVIWSSSNDAIATVDDTLINNTLALVTGIAAGNASITITGSGGKSATVNVTVKAVKVTSVTVFPTTLSMTVGDSPAALSALVIPANAPNKAVTWHSSVPAVASVSSAGVVTPLGEGTTTITVKTVDGNKTAECIVTVAARYTYQQPLGTAADWEFTIHASNAANASKYSIEEFDYEGETVLKFTWADFASFGNKSAHTESNIFVEQLPVFVGSPNNMQIEDFDGLTFDILMVDHHYNNYIMAIKESIGVNYSKGWLLHDAVYTAPESQYIMPEYNEWSVSQRYPFVQSRAMWGASGALKTWLNGTGKTLPKRLDMTPIVNDGKNDAGVFINENPPSWAGAINTKYTFYLRNIGFYKGPQHTVSDVHIIWK